jgi:hypothetical protein
VLEAAVFQHGTLGVDLPGLGAPQRQTANGIGHAGACHGGFFGFQACRGAVVGGHQQLKGRTVVYLGVELARGPEHQHGLVAAVALELGHDGLHGSRHVGSHRHLHRGCLGRGPAQQGRHRSYAQQGRKRRFTHRAAV